MPDGSDKPNGVMNHDNNQKEASGLKRGREASLEPSAPESHQMLPSTSLKKNRLEEQQSESTKRTSPIPEDIPSTKVRETKTVSEVRRKVEKMSHTEGDEVVTDMEEETHGKDLKRKAIERSESSAAVGESEPKRVKDTPSPPIETPAATAQSSTTESTPAIPPKKPQATFGAFTSSASPFAKSSSASGSGSSAFGSTSSAPKPFSSSGFGGFSGSSSPFSSKKTTAFGAAAASTSTASASAPMKNGDKAEPKDVEGEDKEKDEADETQKKEKNGDDFVDILAGVGDGEEVKDRPQMTEQDVVTGEEDEATKFQMRTKLYVMQSDNSWRERGVGVLRLNVRRGDGHGARLVMRAEGVLRLILNVSLYVGQSCLEDGKHVRTTVFEDGERRFVTFKTGSVKAAQELASHIQEYIPLESNKSSKSPEPTTTGKKSDNDDPSGGW